MIWFYPICFGKLDLTERNGDLMSMGDVDVGWICWPVRPRHAIDVDWHANAILNFFFFSGISLWDWNLCVSRNGRQKLLNAYKVRTFAQSAHIHRNSQYSYASNIHGYVNEWQRWSGVRYNSNLCVQLIKLKSMFYFVVSNWIEPLINQL